MDHVALEGEARRAPLAWVQRLGYLLALVEVRNHTEVLEPIVRNGKPFVVALAPSLSKTGAPRDPHLNVAVNMDVEPDL
jgi:hypothetical protein